MKIVVDSNIVFSAILNTRSRIGQLIINGSKYFDFFTIALLKDEILDHKDKIIAITGFSESQFEDTFQILLSRVKLVDDILLTDHDLSKAMELVQEIDIDDAMFVALNNHLLASLWTGDKRLINGLKKKGYNRVITTDELNELFINKQLRHKYRKK